MSSSFYISINGAVAVPTESLNLAALQITAQNAAPGELLMRWQPCGAPETAAGSPLDLDDEVVLSRDGTVLFRGTVESPMVSAKASGGVVSYRVVDAFGAWRQRHFVRGQWWPVTRYPYPDYEPELPAPEPDYSPFTNSPYCVLYKGYYWSEQTLGEAHWDAKLLRQQSLPQAIEELVYYTAQMDARDGITGGTVALGTMSFGDAPLTPESTYEQPTLCIDWLVKILRPQLDGYARLVHGESETTLEAGRSRDIAARVLLAAEILERGVATKTEDQAAAFIAGVTATDTGGQIAITPTSVTPPTGSWVDRRVVPAGLSSLPSLWYAGLSDLIAASVMLPRPEGEAVLVPELWPEVQPGSRVTLGGVTVNVQRAVWDLGRDVVSISAGSPRQLGVQDLEDLKLWIARNWSGYATVL